MKATLITLTAIVAIVILEALAITHGIDKWTLATALAAIAGLGGYEIGFHRKK